MEKRVEVGSWRREARGEAPGDASHAACGRLRHQGSVYRTVRGLIQQQPPCLSFYCSSAFCPRFFTLLCCLHHPPPLTPRDNVRQ